jgi:hypothetical protein
MLLLQSTNIFAFNIDIVVATADAYDGVFALINDDGFLAIIFLFVDDECGYG